MNTKHLLIGFMCLMFLASCAWMPKGQCPVTANGFVKNSTDTPIKIMISKQEGVVFTFITKSATILLPGESGEMPLVVGDYLIIIWDRAGSGWSEPRRFETSIRCKSKVWEYKNKTTLGTYDYIGNFKADVKLIPTILY